MNLLGKGNKRFQSLVDCEGYRANTGRAKKALFFYLPIVLSTSLICSVFIYPNFNKIWPMRR